MDRAADILLTDLRRTVADLGKDGGLISPSIYDTAQALRLAPPPEGPWPGLAWLLEQQRAGGDVDPDIMVEIERPHVIQISLFAEAAEKDKPILGSVISANRMPSFGRARLLGFDLLPNAHRIRRRSKMERPRIVEIFFVPLIPSSVNDHPIFFAVIDGHMIGSPQGRFILDG